MERAKKSPLYFRQAYIAKAWMQNATDVDVVFQRNDIWEMLKKNRNRF